MPVPPRVCAPTSSPWLSHVIQKRLQRRSLVRDPSRAEGYPCPSKNCVWKAASRLLQPDSDLANQVSLNALPLRLRTAVCKQSDAPCSFLKRFPCFHFFYWTPQRDQSLTKYVSSAGRGYCGVSARKIEDSTAKEPLTRVLFFFSTYEYLQRLSAFGFYCARPDENDF